MAIAVDAFDLADVDRRVAGEGEGRKEGGNERIGRSMGLERAEDRPSYRSIVARM
jgi:hypothetical protein